ncbi:hypothetical protein PP635_gp44 [Arthrobacter phage Auxilium]|uniref:Uncharacterized protein n=1 Tax=Arthrobacter phage Auxilium TaxID=2419948 RepID=A0A3G2K9Z7_9CAUD|nr:hypothetical protein PP635_gp44 [Arthrobacter phage Auxilium]AYN55823.1 hypothetical protein PBI_AUXILIUM_44 [Arthrobacter phage Auxilium]
MTAVSDRLDVIQDRVDAATEGPWMWGPETSEWGDCGPNLETVKRGPVYSDGSQGAEEQIIGSWGHDANGISVATNDAEFIAHAREDVPFLLDLTRKQQAAMDAVRALHRPINVYDECECPDGTHPEEYDYIDCEDYVGCENSFSHYACEVCCTANDYITEWCSDTHDHTTESGCLCPTIRALEANP